MKTSATNDETTDRTLGELVLYIAQKCSEHPKFGATKLNKILFFSDFLAFQREGRSISGACYMKLEHGPVPRRLKPVVHRLEREGAAAMEVKPLLGGRVQKRLRPLREPVLDSFHAKQIDLVHDVIEALKDATAEEVSEFSHNRIWEVAELNEEIPYEAVFICDDDSPSEEDNKLIANLSERFGWDA